MCKGKSAPPRRALQRGRPMTSVSVPLTVTDWELARRSSIRAFRAGRYVLILAEGELPTPGYEVDIESVCSACGRDPDVAVGEFGEDVEGPAAVFGRGR